MRKGTLTLVWAAAVAAGALGASRAPAMVLTLLLAAEFAWVTGRVLLERTDLRRHVAQVLHLHGGQA